MWNEEIQQFCIEEDNFCCSLGEYFINRDLAHLTWDCTKVGSSPEAAGARGGCWVRSRQRCTWGRSG